MQGSKVGWRRTRAERKEGTAEAGVVSARRRRCPGKVWTPRSGQGGLGTCAYSTLGCCPVALRRETQRGPLACQRAEGTCLPRVSRQTAAAVRYEPWWLGAMMKEV